MPQRDALEESGYPEQDTMDMSVSTSADQYDTYEEDEDQLYMQQAPNDTLIGLQLLRSQFPAKARVGTFHYSAGRMSCRLPTCTALIGHIRVHQAGLPLQMHVQEVVQPFMLRSQLYSLVDDRTLVDRELDDLRCGLHL